MTLDQLSELSGVEVGTISALEIRDSTRSGKFSALAKALGMTSEQLEDANYFPNQLLASSNAKNQSQNAKFGEQQSLSGYAKKHGFDIIRSPAIENLHNTINSLADSGELTDAAVKAITTVLTELKSVKK